jgi:hypothetical protein
MVSDLFNILMIMLMLTGALCWVSAIVLCWYYWSCNKKKEK